MKDSPFESIGTDGYALGGIIDIGYLLLVQLIKSMCDETLRTIVAHPTPLSLRVLQVINMVALQKEYENMVCYDFHELLLALIVVSFL